MYNDRAMLGQDQGMLASYWDQVKQFMSDLVALPSNIQQSRTDLAQIMGVAYQKGDTDTYQQAVDSLNRLNAMVDTANSVAQKINDYAPQWMQAEQQQAQSSGMSGLGFIPLLVLGVAAAAALAYVAVQGLSLLKQYESENNLIADLKAKSITLEQAKTLIQAGKPVSAAETFASTLGGGISKALIPVFLLGGGFLIWQFMKKGRTS